MDFEKVLMTKRIVHSIVHSIDIRSGNKASSVMAFLQFKVRLVVSVILMITIAILCCKPIYAFSSSTYGDSSGQSVVSEGEKHSYNGPLVTLSPDGTAFTFGFKDRTSEIYGYDRMGYVHTVNGVIGIPEAGTGQHLYNGVLVGMVPVAYWKVSFVTSQCIHSNSSTVYTISALDKIGSNASNCHRRYNPGWMPYCAYCGELITWGLFYITEDMAGSISNLPSGTEFSNYFYLCPYDLSLENYVSINHRCSIVSANRYKVNYNPGEAGVTGRMESGWFYYGNANEYNGTSVTARTTLDKCGYELKNRAFIGWSDRPGGEVIFQDEEEWIKVQDSLGIGNLENGEAITLYAVWSDKEEKVVTEPTPEIKSDELVLHTEVIRSLESVDGRSKFIRGESGILKFKTEGDADYVIIDFPESMKGYSAVFDYSRDDKLVNEEQIDFMIPIYGISDDVEQLTVKVTAYKDDCVVTSYPKLLLIPGSSVLDEIRTSLR